MHAALVSAFATLAPRVLAVAGETAEAFSRSMERHHMDMTHGPLDSVLVWGAVLVVLATTIYTVRFFVRPGETGEDHIKRRVLREDGPSPARTSR
jgi:hypothetical protein